MYRLEIELPGLPPTTNGAQGSWRAAAGKRKFWRTATCILAKAKRPQSPLTSCRITATRFSSAEPDYDNLVISFKSVIDGLKDAGVINDDKNSVVKERLYLWFRAPKGKGRVGIVVEEIEWKK